MASKSNEPILQRIPVFPYIGDVFYIRNVSGQDMHCFVSKYTGGEDSWYLLTSCFRAAREGSELIAFKNGADTQRVGFYLITKGKITYITFHSFDNVDIQTS
nr:cholesterol binding protein [Grifola frondosa]